MSSTTSTSPVRMPPMWLLVFITLAGTLAMHMFVPALPAAAQQLHATPSQVQLTITVYIVGLGVGQLIYGPLSDSLGRRPMLLAGLTLYTLAGIAAFFAPTIEALVAARFLQALGGCAGVSLGRAIARDTATPNNAVSKLALLNLMMMIGPGIAPTIGSWVDNILGWRAIFAALAVVGGITLTGVCLLLPETAPASGHFNFRKLKSDYRTLLTNPSFLGFAIGGGCATTAIYAFISAAPFIFRDQLQSTHAEVGLYLGLIMIGIGIGSAITPKLIKRYSVEQVMMLGNLACMLGAASLLVQALTQVLTAHGALASMMVFTLGAGLASPTALGRAMGAVPRLTGLAAGMFGVMQMVVGGICTFAASLGSSRSISSASVLLLASIIGHIAFRYALRQPRPTDD